MRSLRAVDETTQGEEFRVLQETYLADLRETADGLHPNTIGYQAVSQRIAQAIEPTIN